MDIESQGKQSTSHLPRSPQVYAWLRTGDMACGSRNMDTLHRLGGKMEKERLRQSQGRIVDTGGGYL